MTLRVERADGLKRLPPCQTREARARGVHPIDFGIGDAGLEVGVAALDRLGQR